MTKAAAYVRVSTNGQKIDGESLNTQRSTIQNYCDTRNWELVNVHEDAGISGIKDDRPALQSLLSAARTGEIEVVVVRDLSRFGRSARDLLVNIQTLIARSRSSASRKALTEAVPTVSSCLPSLPP
jgi:site-specific DNA recombinase